MIIVDTNIYIDYWKNPSEKWTEVFQKNEIATCGVIQTELLRGANSDIQFNQIKTALECFEYLPFDEKDWLELSKLFLRLKKEGLSFPFQDGIIAYLAIKNNCQIWTNDKHFTQINIVCPEIELLK